MQLHWNKSADDLVGKYIFHQSKGGIPLISIFSSECHNIGVYLGQVVEHSGFNRIYYLDSENNRKYVSIKGIGIICSSLEEVEQVNLIRKEAKYMLEDSVRQVAEYINNSLSDLTED